jgi:hypothetical protein
MPISSERVICVTQDYAELFVQGERPSGVVLLPANVSVDEAFLDKLSPGLADRIKRFLASPPKATDKAETEDKQVESGEAEDKSGPRPVGRPRSRY